MSNINRIILSGNLVRDPETKEFGENRSLTTFTIAVNRKYKTQQGELKVTANFFKVVTWNNIARICARYLSKGRAVLIDGELVARSYEDKEGKRRNLVEVVGNHVSFLSHANSNASSLPA
jgi:single-strand DNA-binding protein